MIPLRDDNPTTSTPVVTVLIIAACLFIYAFVQPHGSGDTQTAWLVEHAAIPCEVVHHQPISPALSDRCDGGVRFTGLAGSEEPFPGKNVWLAVIVSMFLHASWLHVGGNMLFLWIFGNNVEDRFGKIGYSAFYLAAGIIAAATQILTQPSSTVPVVGASGAIAGVMGAYLVLFPRARVLTFVFIFIVPLPAWLVLGGWFVLQVVTPDTGVAIYAHIGGFIFGAVIGLFLRGPRTPSFPPRVVDLPPGGSNQGR